VAEVLRDRAAEVAAGDDAAAVAERAYERLDVARARGDVVDAVAGRRRGAEAAEVGGDDLEARGRQRLDVAPPDPVRLRPAVEQHERHATGALVDEGQLDGAADGPAVERERAASRDGNHDETASAAAAASRIGAWSQ
jgi:hypothetical protein